MAKVSRRSVELEQRWRGLIEEQAGSGQSVRAFCQAKGIAEPSLYAWRRELALRDRQRSQASAGAELFAPVRVVVEPPARSLGSSIEIALGSAVVRVAGDFDESLLARVLAVLRQAMSGTDAREVRSC